MKKADFAILCLKLLGIYFLVWGLSSLFSVVSVILQSAEPQHYYPAGTFLYVIAGLILLLAAKPISSFIIGFSEADENNVQIVATEQSARLAFIILGIYIFAYSLPHLIQISIDVGIYYAKIDEIPKSIKSKLKLKDNDIVKVTIEKV